MEQRTALYGEHVRAGARMVPFAGFSMPLQYSGIIDEHNAVRRAAGLFDLSHMGEFRVTGPGALDAVEGLVTNDISGLEVGQIRYTPMTYHDGGIVDDILVYRFPDHLMLVVNAANIEKDLAWVREHLPAGVQVEDVSDEIALIAVQGPRAEGIVQGLTAVPLAGILYYHVTEGQVAGVEAIISRTGYTGEDGFELYVRPEDASVLWTKLLDAGRSEGLKPAGLGARDTLRLEAGYMLYGNDIHQYTSPIEAGLGWTVKFDHSFSGRDVLERQKAEGPAQRLVALEMEDRAIPRPHSAIWSAEEGPVGEVTSGTFSPTVGRGIALGYVPRRLAKTGTQLEIEIRKARHPARVVRKPIYRREGA